MMLDHENEKPRRPEKPWQRAARINKAIVDLERCPGVPHPATFGTMLRKWLAIGQPVPVKPVKTRRAR
jgi:hypothetical protein